MCVMMWPVSKPSALVCMSNTLMCVMMSDGLSASHLSALCDKSLSNFFMDCTLKG